MNERSFPNKNILKHRMSESDNSIPPTADAADGVETAEPQTSLTPPPEPLKCEGEQKTPRKAMVIAFIS